VNAEQICPTLTGIITQASVLLTQKIHEYIAAQAASAPHQLAVNPGLSLAELQQKMNDQLAAVLNGM